MNYQSLRLKPTDSGFITMDFQSQKCLQRQSNVIALRPSTARLTSFNVRELLDAAMKVLYRTSHVIVFTGDYAVKRIDCFEPASY
jgi:hypothetical protein